MIDGDSVVARLCSAGMATDGDAVAAGALFRQAWDARRDDYEASIAAHFLARHQPSLNDSLYWNRVAALQRVCARVAQAAAPVADI